MEDIAAEAGYSKGNFYRYFKSKQEIMWIGFQKIDQLYNVYYETVIKSEQYRDYSNVSDTARANVERLEQAMTAAGFQGYAKEWWHFTDTTDYPMIQ